VVLGTSGISGSFQTPSIPGGFQTFGIPNGFQTSVTFNNFFLKIYFMMERPSMRKCGFSHKKIVLILPLIKLIFITFTC